MGTFYYNETVKTTELQKQVDELKKRLHWIWAIGVDYDGLDKAESLKGLIDEMVELTQIESKDLDEYFTYNTTQGGKMNILSIVRKIERKDTAKKFAKRLKSDVSEDNELHEALNAYLKRDYLGYIDERCNEIMEGIDNGKNI